ncbi:lipopolysaccharide biosynthesis protein [Chromohalobacter israelensis]|uniref:lipopolysaccharide biosynthesis protein n=1 Tax=Chromohalobacter israelensis TaxID=141390 RepID=UPI001CC6FA9F|nr:lipopolysaccharide biosynthesis protein [Chromohalobacter salexigens]MBZ5877360.1 lipopolysaccharide biosynthesis protein [Chromohalobacter salexigens]
MLNLVITLRQKTHEVWHSRFVRSVAVIATGTAGAQAITMAFAPLITRLYGPEAYGVQGTFMAILGVAVPIGALAYPISIVLPRRDEEALGIIQLSVCVSVFVAALLALGLWLVGEVAISILEIESVGDFIYLVPVAMLLAAWKQIAQEWLIRKKEFGVIARSALATSGILNSARALAGFVHPVGAVLIVLATLVEALHTLLMLIGIRKRTTIDRTEPSEVSKVSIIELARRHRDFPLYRAPQIMINAASQSLPVLMLSAFFGPSTAGFYMLSIMVMGMPTALVGMAVSDVFYARITEAAHNGENLSRHILRATGVLAVIGLIPFSIVMFFGPWMFSLVFGAEWSVAGEYARWLAFFFFFNLVNKPSNAAVPVLGIQRGLLFYEVLSTGGKVAGFLLGFYWLNSDIWAVATFSIIGVFAYGGVMLWIYLRAVRWDRDARISQ